MKVPFIDLKRQVAPIRAAIDRAMKRVVDRQLFVLGEEVRELESSFGEAFDIPHAIGCGSGSQAISLALQACGVKPGDEVLVPGFTFYATGGEVARLGAVPVFCDIRSDGFDIDPADCERRITPRTRAILVVHLYGRCCRMKEIRELADRHDLRIVEDAAQAVGATYRGTSAGALGDAAAFSFYPTKNLGGFGDGGMVTTTDSVLAERLRRLRNLGDEGGYHHVELGTNARLDELQAAVLRVKLEQLAGWNAARSRHAARYDEAFSDLPFRRPRLNAEGRPSTWHQYTIRVRDRDGLRSHLQSRGVGAAIYYPRGLHEQPALAEFADGELPEVERTAREVLSLPVFPELTGAEQDAVIGAVRAFFSA